MTCTGRNKYHHVVFYAKCLVYSLVKTQISIRSHVCHVNHVKGGLNINAWIFYIHSITFTVLSLVTVQLPYKSISDCQSVSPSLFYSDLLVSYLLHYWYADQIYAFVLRSYLKILMIAYAIKSALILNALLISGAIHVTQNR